MNTRCLAAITLTLCASLHSIQIQALDLSFDATRDGPEEETLATENESRPTGKPLIAITSESEGWVLKAPSVGSAVAPVDADRRESVRQNEERYLRQNADNNGRGISDDPANLNNYRVEVGAEYHF